MVRVSRILSVFLLLAAIAGAAADDAYRQRIEQDRRDTDTFLRSPKSPLLLIGRFSIQEGSSTLGSDPASTIVLPSRAPHLVGTLSRHGNQLSLEVAPDVSVSLNGKPATGSVALRAADVPNPTDRVSFGDFTFGIRPAGGGFDLFLADARSSFLNNFKGTTWFPIDPAYSVVGQFKPADHEETVMVPYTDGASKAFKVSGELVFQLSGQTLRLEALASPGGKGLFVMFRDQTSGKQTYGGGRYLEAEAPQEGKTTLDFNKAFNPYCAYDPYTTCPVVPARNQLPLAVLAGETYDAKSAQH